MSQQVLVVKKSAPLRGTTHVYGAKNSVLVSMAACLLAPGITQLTNVPHSADVHNMAQLLELLGAQVALDDHTATIITPAQCQPRVDAAIMRKMRASILVAGPLVARCGVAYVAAPGGCVIGTRPIDLHLSALAKIGISCIEQDDYLVLTAGNGYRDGSDARIVLDYPSVGATENAMMAAVLRNGTTTIVNAACEPEVMSLVDMLNLMGADISWPGHAVLRIVGVRELQPLRSYEVIPDRLEVGTILAAAAITVGSVTVSNARENDLEVVLEKLRQMGHEVVCDERGITLTGTASPRAVSFKTGPYPNFATDLQAPMMALQVLANGRSVIDETVFENRFMQVKPLEAMGATIQVHGSQAQVCGVEQLFGAAVVASDIRASSALVIAGLAAQGVTIMSGVSHWQRGYDELEVRLAQLGADIAYQDDEQIRSHPYYLKALQSRV